jgi:hypothetical protein
MVIAAIRGKPPDAKSTYCYHKRDFERNEMDQKNLPRVPKEATLWEELSAFLRDPPAQIDLGRADVPETQGTRPLPPPLRRTDESQISIFNLDLESQQAVATENLARVTERAGCASGRRDVRVSAQGAARRTIATQVTGAPRG